MTPGNGNSTAGPIPHDEGRRAEFTHRVERRLVADDGAPSRARKAVTAFASAFPEELIERAELAASELVTNAIIHGSMVGSEVTVVVEIVPGRLTLDVADAGGSGVGATGGEGGYGLGIVESIADSLEIDAAGPWRVVAEFIPR